MSDNIKELVEKASNGSVDAMAKLYSLTLKPSFFLANELCADEKAAEEIASKAYARAFCNISKLKKPESFELWMKQNIAVAYKESKKFNFDDSETVNDDGSTEFLSENTLSDNEKIISVSEAVKALKPELKAVTILHYNNGMSVANLAKLLGISEETVNAFLSKARACILLWSGADGADAEKANPVPVLTRIFQLKEAAADVPGESVRGIFSYAFGEYKNSLVKSTFAAPPSIEDAEPAKAPEDVKAEEEAKTGSDESDNLISFKQKISEILSQKPEENASDTAEEKSEESGEDDDGLVIPELGGNQPKFDFMPDTEEKADVKEDTPKKKFNLNIPFLNKIDFKKFNFSAVTAFFKKIGIKKIVIALVALVAVIGAIIGISNAVKASKERKAQADIPKSNFVAGGFEDCEELEYLNEYFCVFKSKTTGKYGLIDYDGKLLLQPNYDEFSNCGNGRDYSNRNSYHTIVKVGSVNHEVTYLNGQVNVSEEVYKPLSIVIENLNSKNYVERDRFFEGYAAAQNSKGQWGYISKETDKKVIPFEYQAVNDFTDMQSNDYCRPVTGGLVAVKKDGKMGIINLKNEIIAGFEYENIMPGKNGIFIAKKDGVWGVILTGTAMNSFSGVNLSVNAAAVVPSGVSSTPIASYVVGEYGANVRSDAGSDFDLVAELKEGDKVDAYARKDSESGSEWVCVLVNGQYGWVSMKTLEVG